MQGAVRQQTDGVSFVDAKTCQLPVRVGQNAGSPGGIGQGHISQHRLPGGQLLAAVQLLVDAQNAVCHTIFLEKYNVLVLQMILPAGENVVFLL